MNTHFTYRLLLGLFFCICSLQSSTAQSYYAAGSNSGMSGVPATYMDMVNSLFGTGLTISNITLTADTTQHQVGWFGGGPVLGLDYSQGLVMTSGNIQNTVGPNSQTGISASLNASGDTDLGAIVGMPTYDAAILAFDLIPTLDTFSVHYTFGSDEYMEFAGTNFNDVFAFMITGPNPNGGAYNKQNFALVPGTANPTSINNVNCNSNNTYYICNQDNTSSANACPSSICPVNNSLTALEYDGLTTDLDAYIPVVPLQTYHIKLAIADVGDGILDSGVFLQGGGISCRGNNGTAIQNIANVGASLRVFPNPSEGKLNLNVEMKNRQNVTISLKDMYGKTITSLHNGNLEQGKHNFRFDGSDLAKGCYFMELSTEKGKITEKCVLF